MKIKKIKATGRQTINILLGCCLSLYSCSQPFVGQPTITPPSTSNRWVNTAHLDKLYATSKLSNGVEVATIGIYADYPAYKVVSAKDEGFTCIDDVSRAALFYLNESDISTNTQKQEKLSKMTEFVLQLQSDNGYFYNFLQDDFTINKTYQTSIANANWWSWRALWHLSAAHPFYQKNNGVIANRIQTAITKLLINIKRDFAGKASTTLSNNLVVPTWLPAGSGTDQAAIMILGLLNVYQQQPDADVLTLINHLAEGILLMQQGDKDNFPYATFLSWKNTWHAYGCDQSFALLMAGKALNKPLWIAAAQKEIDNFYPFLVKQGFINSFELAISSGKFIPQNQTIFSQISYGIRPMISATLALYEIKNDPKYLTLAAQICAWYVGNNLAKVKMYNKSTGVCFDGISSASDYNKNAGAESTIEALWAMQLAEKYPLIITELEKYK